MRGWASESFVYAADGTRLYVRERTAVEACSENEPRGFDVQVAPSRLATILSDGICCDGYIWKYLWDDLSPLTKVVHWNYRGHGRSAPPHDAGRIDIPAHADDLEHVRVHVGDEPVVLVGHSMGCQVALETYHRRPEKVRGLVLLCGSSGRLTQTFHNSDLLARMLPRVIRFAEAHRGLTRGLWSRIPVQSALSIAFAAGEVDKSALDPADLLPYFEHAADMDFLLFLRMLEITGHYSASDFLGSVDVPVLVIAGEMDKFTPHRLAEDMAKALPRAKLVTLAGATHVAPLEKREVVADEVNRFIAQAMAEPSR